MEGQFKWCIYNLFSSPLNPCQPKNMLEVVETPTSFAKIRRNPRLIDLFSPKVEIQPPKSRVNNKDTELAPRLSSSCVHEIKKVKKKEDKNSSSSGNNNRGFRRSDMHLSDKSNNRVTFSSSSSRESNNFGWFSSEEDYYSGRRAQARRSKSDFYEQPPRVPRRKKPTRRKEEDDGVKHHRCCTKGGSEESSVGSTSNNDVKYNPGGVVVEERFVHPKKTANRNEEEQFRAVEKSSRDPYKDFRASMVEMIVEKQISGADELEQLLVCFLSLNSTYHHKIIVQVFSEILEALFH